MEAWDFEAERQHEAQEEAVQQTYGVYIHNGSGQKQSEALSDLQFEAAYHLLFRESRHLEAHTVDIELTLILVLAWILQGGATDSPRGNREDMHAWSGLQPWLKT